MCCKGENNVVVVVVVVVGLEEEEEGAATESEADGKGQRIGPSSGPEGSRRGGGGGSTRRGRKEEEKEDATGGGREEEEEEGEKHASCVGEECGFRVDTAVPASFSVSSSSSSFVTASSSIVDQTIFALSATLAEAVANPPMGECAESLEKYK